MEKSSNKRPTVPVEQPAPDCEHHRTTTITTTTIATTFNNKRARVSVEQNASQTVAEEERKGSNRPLLVVDVFSIVMSMLAPREMLRLSCCSKSLLKMVNHENVVRNTIMLGGHSRNSLKSIMELLRSRKIFFPSALRLLRIACGQRCEIGCDNTVHTIRSHYGVFCCFSCSQKEGITHSLALSSEAWSNNEKLRSAVDHPRIARYDYQRKVLLWRSPLKTPNGERCGPLVTMDEITDMLANNKTVDDHIASLDAEYDQKLLDALLKMDEEATEKAAVNDKKEKRERDERVRRFRRTKAEKLEEALGKIKAMLDPRWKNIALKKYFYSNDGWSRFRHFPDNHEYNPKFESPLVRSIESLDKLLHAPTKYGVMKRIARCADAIDKVFERVFNNGFHDFSFLSSDEEGNAFEAHLREALRAKYPLDEWLANLDRQDVDKIEASGPLLALACKLTGDRDRLYRPPACFAVAVVPYLNISDKRDTDEEFAKALWNLKTHDKDWVSFQCKCRETFEYTAKAFKRLRPKILEYLDHPATIAFLNELGGRNESWLRVKRDEVNKIWVEKDLLLNFMQDDVDFDSLREDQATNAESRWLGGHW